MLCLSPLLSPLSSPPSFLYPPCIVCPAHSLLPLPLPLPLPHNQKSFPQMCMLAFPSIIHNQSFGRARDDGLATWEILQRVTAPAQDHRWERSPASFFEQCRQCNAMAMQVCSAIGSAIGENCLPPILFSLLFPLISPSPFSSPPTPLLICPHPYPYPPKTGSLPSDPHRFHFICSQFPLKSSARLKTLE